MIYDYLKSLIGKEFDADDGDKASFKNSPTVKVTYEYQPDVIYTIYTKLKDAKIVITNIKESTILTSNGKQTKT